MRQDDSTVRKVVARLLCEQHGGNPDAVATDEHDSWDGPLWSVFVSDADAILALMARPSNEAIAGGSGAIGRAADAILANLRDRRLLKYLFHDTPDQCGPYGYIDTPIDLETQRECAETLAVIALRALKSFPADGATGAVPEGMVLVPRVLSDWMRGEGMRAHMDALYDGKKLVNQGIEDGLKAVTTMWPALLAAAESDAKRLAALTPAGTGEEGK